jgi:hypothetical protein
MGMLRTALVFGGSALAVIATSAACLDPTEITVDIATDVKCEDTKGTSIVGGRPGSIELASPTTMTRDCDNGRIGTLVSTPPDSKDVDAAFLVVLGVDRPVSECTADNHFQGCIVQRRLIHYIKHTPLNLPVTMWLVCKDVECGPETTCARNGKCVSARIPDPASCASSPCFIEGDGPFVPGVDGGTDTGTDSRVADAGADSPRVGDADADAPIVVDPPPPGNRLYCPNYPNNCNIGGTCCFSHSGSGGVCDPPSCDPAANTVMRCNRKSDCALPTDFCCGTVVAALDIAGGGKPVLSHGPGLVPEASLNDASSGTRTLTSTACQTAPGACVGSWICTTLADCPSGMGFNLCDTTSTLFNPLGTFGECK